MRTSFGINPEKITPQIQCVLFLRHALLHHANSTKIKASNTHHLYKHATVSE